MAHFAKVDENNRVLNVVVVDNSEAPDEATGIAFCENTLGPGTYLQTSYNTFEKNIILMVSYLLINQKHLEEIMLR